MALQIKPSVTNPTVADVYQLIDEGKLILRPDFQRKFVWTVEHQESFIDTILKGLPFPEIYVCEGEIDVQKLRTTRLVIDMSLYISPQPGPAFPKKSLAFNKLQMELVNFGEIAFTR